MMRHSLLTMALLVSAALAATGCTAGTAATSACATTLADAPDELPAWLFEPENIVQDDPELAGPFVKRTLTLLFMPDATPGQRAHAISLVEGCVVAHQRDDLEGLYYVQVPGSGASALLRAVDRLNELPYVAGATVLLADDPASTLDTIVQA